MLAPGAIARPRALHREPPSGPSAAARSLGGTLATHAYPLGLAGLALFAFALRLAFAGEQSAYMDEGTNVLTGRLLIEQHAVYAEILNWAYGSYLWPLVAGVADMAGGLGAVRAVTAACGAIMALATALAAARLAPATLSPARRRTVALLAGGIMAIAPTAIAVGRFGTYDALAGAAFMLGVSLVVPVLPSARGPAHPWQLLVAAALLFVAFLSKYLVAIYFPFLCAYLVLGAARRPRLAVRNLLWFVVPLATACAVYLYVFLGPLLTLLSASLRYADLKSADPVREYVWTRPELWLLAIAAGFGWWTATRSARAVALGGTAIILAFQAEARPDFDFWKHSIYVLYFLAPLAALAWARVPQHTGTWRVVALGTVGVAAAWGSVRATAEASRLIDFYPNLSPSIAAIETYTAGAALVLTDDTAVRYYLYPAMATDRVIGPFAFTYKALDGLDAYRAAIADRYFDTIVLDGGVTPQGNAIGQQLGAAIDERYTRVYAADAGQGSSVAIYKAIPSSDAPSTAEADGSWPIAYRFDAGADDWGGHPDAGDWQAGLQVSTSDEQPWNGHPALRFAPSEQVSALTLRRAGPVRRVRASVYLVTGDPTNSPVRIGLVGFDDAWHWTDDGFRWLVAPGAWTTVSWDLPRPGAYHELGFKFPPEVRVAYVGDYEIDP
jgi:hypothetical protein